MGERAKRSESGIGRGVHAQIHLHRCAEATPHEVLPACHRHQRERRKVGFNLRLFTVCTNDNLDVSKRRYFLQISKTSKKHRHRYFQIACTNYEWKHFEINYSSKFKILFLSGIWRKFVSMTLIRFFIISE